VRAAPGGGDLGGDGLDDTELEMSVSEVKDDRLVPRRARADRRAAAQGAVKDLDVPGSAASSSCGSAPGRTRTR
jgi:hypothetical protein